MRSSRGQAAPEYLAVLAVVGALLLLTAAVRSDAAIAGAIVQHVRTALCIVGGDVCRSSQAAAAGLDPCVLADDTKHRFGGGTFLVFRAQGHETWAMQTRSDGSVVFTGFDGIDLGGTAAVGVSLAPGVRLEAKTEPELGWRDGRTWVFPSLAAARGFLAAAERAGFQHQAKGLPPATYEFRKGGGSVGTRVGVPLLPGARIALDGALGRREGPEGTTWFVEGSAAATLLGGRHGVLEYTLGADGRPRSLVVRTARPGARGRLTEITGRLDLTAPADRAVAERLLATRDPRDLQAAVSDLRRHWRAKAVIERASYREERERGGLDLSAALGVKVGVNAEHERVIRELEAATVRFPGDDRERRREDCVATV